jgi:hypothetical protein
MQWKWIDEVWNTMLCGKASMFYTGHRAATDEGIVHVGKHNSIFIDRREGAVVIKRKPKDEETGHLMRSHRWWRVDTYKGKPRVLLGKHTPEGGSICNWKYQVHRSVEYMVTYSDEIACDILGSILQEVPIFRGPYLALKYTGNLKHKYPRDILIRILNHALHPVPGSMVSYLERSFLRKYSKCQDIGEIIARSCPYKSIRRTLNRSLQERSRKHTAAQLTLVERYRDLELKPEYMVQLLDDYTILDIVSHGYGKEALGHALATIPPKRLMGWINDSRRSRHGRSVAIDLFSALLQYKERTGEELIVRGNLEDAHDYATQEVMKIKDPNVILDEHEGIQEIKAMVDGQHVDGDLVLRVPHCSHDLVDIGQAMSICVGMGHYTNGMKLGHHCIIVGYRDDQPEFCAQVHIHGWNSAATGKFRIDLTMGQCVTRFNKPTPIAEEELAILLDATRELPSTFEPDDDLPF